MAAASSAPFGFLRLKKIKEESRVLSAARHNLRKLPKQAQIDSSRSKLNLLLAGPAEPKAVVQTVVALMAEAGLKKLRKDAVRLIEALVSLPPNWRGDQVGFFRDDLAWLARWFEGAPIVSATVHLDETNPHMHVLVLPLRNGRMQGSALVGNWNRIQAMHRAHEREVLVKHGLQRPTTPLDKGGKALMVDQVLAHLRATDDSALRSAGWAAVRANIQDSPEYWHTLLGLAAVPRGGASVADDKPIRRRRGNRMRTMAAIFTSPGKGSRRAEKEESSLSWRRPTRAAAKPACDGGSVSGQSLCTVGFQAPAQTAVIGAPSLSVPTTKSPSATFVAGNAGSGAAGDHRRKPALRNAPPHPTGALRAQSVARRATRPPRHDAWPRAPPKDPWRPVTAAGEPCPVPIAFSRLLHESQNTSRALAGLLPSPDTSTCRCSPLAS